MKSLTSHNVLNIKYKISSSQTVDISKNFFPSFIKKHIWMHFPHKNIEARSYILLYFFFGFCRLDQLRMIWNGTIWDGQTRISGISSQSRAAPYWGISQLVIRGIVLLLFDVHVKQNPLLSSQVGFFVSGHISTPW